MKMFETTQEKLERHFITTMLIFVFVVFFVSSFAIAILEQHHEMERYTNKK